MPDAERANSLCIFEYRERGSGCIMQALKTFYDWMYKITMFICKLLLVADILVVCFTVLGRYVSFIPDPTWTEEITLTLMSYMAVLSGGYSSESPRNKLPQSGLRPASSLREGAYKARLHTKRLPL